MNRTPEIPSPDYHSPGELTSRPSSESWMIREDAIQPGDVLLTKGSSWKSKCIKAFSHGKFSHAAIFVSHDTILESHHFVAEASIQSFGHTLGNGYQTKWALLPGNPVEAELWRHPQIDTVSSEQFKQVYEAMVGEYLGMDYSLWVRLMPLLRLPWFLKAFEPTARKMATEAADVYDVLIEQAEVPSMFCSELVAKFFGRLTLKLFHVDRPDEMVSPNDFQHSALRKVEGAIVRLKDISGFVPLASDYWELTSNIPDVDSIIANAKHEDRVFDKQLNDSDGIVQVANSAVDRAAARTLELVAEKISKLVLIVDSLPMPHLKAKVSRLGCEFMLVARGLTAHRRTASKDHSAHQELCRRLQIIMRSTFCLIAITRAQLYKRKGIELRTNWRWGSWLPRQRLRCRRRRMVQRIRNALRRFAVSPHVRRAT